MRVDKTCLMALERTLHLFRDPARLVQDHPTYRMLATPPEALAAGDDGLECIGQIIDRAHNYIVRQGWMLIEHGSTQQRAVRKLLEAQRYYDITCYQDAAGHDRLTECRFVE